MPPFKNRNSKSRKTRTYNIKGKSKNHTVSKRGIASHITKGIDYISRSVKSSFRHFFEEKVTPANYNIVLITTHGNYESLDDENRKESPINFSKINAVIPGVCNILEPEDVYDFSSYIKKLLHEELSYDEFVRNLHANIKNQDNQIYNTDLDKDKYMNKAQVIQYKTASNRSYQLKNVHVGEKYFEKYFSIVTKEKDTNFNYKYNAIILFKDEEYEDIFPKIYENLCKKKLTKKNSKTSVNKKLKVVKFSDVIEYLNNTTDGKDTIFIDLSCGSVISDTATPRAVRLFARSDEKFGGNS